LVYIIFVLPDPDWRMCVPVWLARGFTLGADASMSMFDLLKMGAGDSEKVVGCHQHLHVVCM
jgi:hypothetical protein